MSRRFALLTCAYCALIFYLSGKPLQITEEIPIPQIDKVAHLVLYGGLTWCAGMALRRAKHRYSLPVLFWAPIVFASLYGCSDEFHQEFVPNREFDPFDVVADTLGGLLLQSGLYFYWLRVPFAGVLPRRDAAK